MLISVVIEKLPVWQVKPQQGVHNYNQSGGYLRSQLILVTNIPPRQPAGNIRSQQASSVARPDLVLLLIMLRSSVYLLLLLMLCRLSMTLLFSSHAATHAFLYRCTQSLFPSHLFPAMTYLPPTSHHPMPCFSLLLGESKTDEITPWPESRVFGSASVSNSWS